MSVPGTVPKLTDGQLKKGLEAIKKGDEYRDRGDFDKAKAQYEKALKFYPSEAQGRLVILPLCKTAMESSDPDRFVSIGLRARLHNVKEKVRYVVKRPDPTPPQQQSFFPRPSSPTQSTVTSLVISDCQSTLMSQSTCMTATTSASQSSMTAPSILASETVVSDVGTISDVRSLTAAFNTADHGERGIIKQKIYDIISEFGKSGVTFDTVHELAVLANIRDHEIFLHIVTKILDVLRDMPLLSSIALQGLAVILDLIPDGIGMGSMQGVFVKILASLQDCLRGIRTVNNDLQLIPLLSSLNTLLDAMVRREVFGLDREAVYNDLRTRLTALTSHSNVMVCFQALYAKQALAIIGNDESLPTSIFRRGKLALALAGNISNLTTKFELASAESAYQSIKDFFDFSIRDGWYQGLIYADYLVGQRSWWQLEDFVLHSKFQSDICFQLGITLRLEQIAVVHMDVKKEAINFLNTLGKIHIPLVPEMVQYTLQRLQSLESSIGGVKDDMSAPMAYQSDQRPVWDPAWLASPKGILFKAVTEKNSRVAIMDNLPAQVDTIVQAIQSQVTKDTTPSLVDVQSALKTYYKRELVILRVSGDTLDLETCFVNLAIVEAPAQREKDKQDLKEQAAVFHRVPSSEAVGQVNMQKPIPLEQLFDKRKLRDGKEDIPKTVLVQGRAGVGKTTLCKKLVHAHQTGLWKDRFDAVLWLPLRQIKAYKSRTMEGLFREKFFTQGLDQKGLALAHELAVSAHQGRVLFVLDGLDEVVKDTYREDGFALKDFLADLLQQQHVVITSRPSGVDRSLLPPSIDLELETIGFSQKNVNDFVSKVLCPKAAETVQRFIKKTPLIRGLVNIPVQLDVICYSWDSLPTDGPTVTMTGLYQLMVRKLWCKDAVRLKKSAGGEALTQKDINKLEPQDIDELMATEMRHLGYLAFKGLTNDHQIEFVEKDLLRSFGDLKKYCTPDSSCHLPPQLLGMMKDTSFLHTVDVYLDDSKSDSQQAWYFLHLTFQEYFAATWVAQHFQQPISSGMQQYFGSTKSTNDRQQPLPMGMMTAEHAKAFVQEHKYNPRYEILWWMVAGLLEGEALENFFDLFQGAPRDLIGGRHQQILASCLNEARSRLNTAFVTRMDAELIKWVRFETQTFHGEISTSMLGSQSSFPEALLIKTLGLKTASKAILVSTLGTRSTQSKAAIQSLIVALKDEDKSVRYSAAKALGKRSLLSEAAILPLIGALKGEDKDVKYLAAKALGKQSMLSEAAILSLIDALKDGDDNVRNSATKALNNQSTLSEAATLSLIGALKDDDNAIRSSAAHALGNQSTLSETAILSLIGVLRNESKYVRSSAARVLGKRFISSEAATQSLTDALKDEDKDVRSLAATVLGSQPRLSEVSILSLISALKDEDEGVRFSVAEALGNQSTLSEAVIQSLLDAVKDEDGNVRSAAEQALAKQSTVETAIQPLIDSLYHEDADVRSSVAKALGNQSKLSEAIIQSLLNALKDVDTKVRQGAAMTLGKQSTLSEATILSLIGALKDEGADVRFSAAEALGKRSTLSVAATRSLTDALKDDDKHVRSSAAAVLSNQSTSSEAAILPLIGALRDEDIDVRYFAAKTLGNHSMLPEAAILSLVGALKDEDDNVRSSAKYALNNQSTLSKAAILSLTGALKDDDKSIRSSAAYALGNQSTLSEAAILSLIGALKDEDEFVRFSVAEALGNQSTLSKAVILPLIGVLRDEFKYVRSSAARVLSKQPTLSEAAILSLIVALKDENKYIRPSAASVLGNQSALSEASILCLAGALKDEDVDVRLSAAEALGKQSSWSQAATQFLIDALKNEHADVRFSAAEALGKRSTFSEEAILSLIGMIEDENRFAGASAVKLLGKPSTLSISAIQSLIGVLNHGDANIMRSVTDILEIHCHAVCMALPSLSESEIMSAYRYHLFYYSCRHALSLQVQENRLCYYTEQGLLRTEPMEVDKATLIASAFEAVQRDAWTHT